MNRITALLALAAVSGAALAGPNTWQSSSAPLSAVTNPQFAYLEQFASFRVNMTELRAELNLMPMENTMAINQGAVIFLPGPDGNVQRFRMFNSPIQTPAMERLSGVRTYAAKGIDDPHATGRFDLGINGFHGFVTSPNGDYVIEPAAQGDMTNYLAFFRKDNLFPRDWSCRVIETPKKTVFENPFPLRPGPNRKEYRLAIKGTVEYTANRGGVASATAAAVTSVNRVNQVYIRDHALIMTIVNNVMYAAEPDPYTNNNGFTMLSQNQTTCDAAPGNANYDIGHVFSTGGGGVAGLGVVGTTGQKARGVTGSPVPVGDPFDIDYVAHEMGHQFNANHSFNGTSSACSGNRVAARAYEPGSGSTVMGYAGICGAENVQNNSDAYQHAISQAEVEVLRNGVAAGTTIATANLSPTITVGGAITIPVSTPYRLTASASDPNGDSLTYCWEQFNLGTQSPPTSMTNGPIVRSRNPVASPTRWFPPQTNVINNTTDAWDLLPTLARTMTFRCTVRDNNPVGGNYEWADKSLTVVAGAFLVTAPNSAVSWAGGSSQTVTWDVGGTGPTTPNVRILLSTDGGNSFFNNTATVVLASTANDGSESITVPNTPTGTARIIVEGIANPFYDMSNVNFTITAGTPTPTITSLNPTNTNAGGPGFNLIVTGTGYVNGNSVVRWNGSNRPTTFNSSTQLTAAITAADILNSGVRPITVFNTGAPLSNSVNFTINSVTTQVNPGSVTVISGLNTGGTLASFASSDDNRYIMACDVGSSSIGHYEITGTSPYLTVTRVQLVLEMRASRTDLSEFVSMFNNTTAAFETVNFRVTTLADASTTLTFTTDPGRFVQAGTGLLRSRTRWVPNADIVAQDGWNMASDRHHWTVSN